MSAHGWIAVGLGVLSFGLTACTRRRASDEDCTAIIDRIVAVELAERGFRDPALLARKQAELQGRLGLEAAQCTGMLVRDGAMACVAQAHDAEEISHTCLR